MADTYEISRASAAVTAANPLMEICQPGGATTPRMKISEIDVFWASGASLTLQFGIGRPGNTPTTGTQVVGIADDPAAPAAFGATVITAWGVTPTAPGTFLRQAAIASSAGNGVIWTWPTGKELIIPPNDRTKSIILWCTAIGGATSTTVNATVCWSE